MTHAEIEKAGREFAILNSHEQTEFLMAAAKEASSWEDQAGSSQWYWVGTLLRRKEHEGARDMIDMINHAMTFKPLVPEVETSSSGSIPDEPDPEPEIDLTEPFLEIP